MLQLLFLFWIATSESPSPPPADERVALEISPRPLPAGVRVGLAPRALIAFVDDRVSDRLPLPAVPKKAKRLDDHAVLAMGAHGLWILRVNADGRFVVVRKMKLPDPVTGFELLDHRVLPTVRANQAYVYRSELVPRPAVRAPGEFDHLLPGIRERMNDWPAPRELAEPGFPVPDFYVETNFFHTQATQVYARHDGNLHDELHWGLEMSIRFGFRVYGDHLAGMSLFRLIGYMEPQFDNHQPYDEQVWSMINPTGLFYQYAPAALPVGVQVEPIRVHYREGTPDEYGGRVTLQWVKRSAPMRLGLEMRADMTRTIVRVSFAIVCGFNY
mgnify:CR=1 FL=1